MKKKKPVSGKYLALDAITPVSSLSTLQEYVHDMVLRRGFTKGEPQDILLLLIEEVGELAKAMRKHLGFKIDRSKKENYAIESELADVLILLLDLANALDISLIDAFKAKEKENETRTWS